MVPDKPVQSFVVAPDQAGHRLDRFLVERLRDLSRARARELLGSGRVRVDGRRAHKGDALVSGATVTVEGDLPQGDFSPEPVDDPALRVLHEDDAVAVVEKPAGMPTHPLRPDETDTLANRIVARWPETAGVGFHRREPGLLHRLDTATSGLVIVARTPEAFEALRASTKAGTVVKHYLALVEGRLVGRGAVDLPLVPHRKDPKRVEVVTDHVRLRAGTRVHEARTRWRVVRPLGDHTLVEAEVHAAFRHQVRAHLAHLGHPLVGDRLYRGPSMHGLAAGRHFLHANEVVFPHPVTGREVRVGVPLPADLQALVDGLARAR